MRTCHSLRGVLTVIAVLAGLHLAERLTGGHEGVVWGLVTPPAASAASAGAPDETAGLLSAAEQRKQIIAELKRISQQLEALDGRLKAGISVKVTDMPEIKLPEPPKGENP